MPDIRQAWLRTAWRRIAMITLLALLFMLVSAYPQMPHVLAQGPCGVANNITFPLDTNNFRVIYAYNVPSSRFDGRLHAGMDMVGSGGTTTYGAPVRAVAAGRVTYAAPFGWGTDKGVVIIEHLMPDGTIWYSFYGHMEEFPEDNILFPTVFTCVQQGDIVGGIGRPRPAPHLHFEIRNFWPDSPGPGYWGSDPTYEGWRNPAKFIYNWQTWLSPFHRWHADIADEDGPVFPAIVRDDNVLLTFDNNRLMALDTSGQIIWRYIMDEDFAALGMLRYQDSVLLANREGELQLWSLIGGWQENWLLPHPITTAPQLWGDLLVVHTPDEELIAYGPDRTERWRVAGIPRPVKMLAAPALLGIASTRSQITFIDPGGNITGQATLRRSGDLALAPDGGFYVRSQTGLWRVDADGSWHLLADTPAIQASSAAFFSLPDGRFFLYTGSRDQILYAYAGQGSPLWSAALAAFQGTPAFFNSGSSESILLADGYGTIAVLTANSGAICNQLRAWGNRSASAWAGLGVDGVLRLHIADQVLGLDWAALTSGCE